MIWYQTGTISVANGSTIVTAMGAAFVNNVAPGAGFITGDGRVYPVAEVNSDGQLTLEVPYQGATIAGAAYYILPTQAYDLMLARRIMTLTDNFADVRDGVGQGMFSDGSVAAPGVRFANDQDTGLRRYSGNSLALVTGGVDRIICDHRGYLGVGTAPVHPLDVAAQSGPYVAQIRNVSTAPDQYSVVLISQNAPGAPTGYIGTGASGVGNPTFANNFVIGTQTSSPVVISVGDSERLRVDTAGNLLVGVTSAATHRVHKNASEGENVLELSGAGNIFARFSHVVGSFPNAAGAALYLNKHSLTDRSIAASGTINAAGADLAEHMRKADGCGIIAKGDVCGVDANGELTKSWSAMISPVVKSTKPALVGNDYGLNLPPPPEAPVEPIAPPAPTTPAELGVEPIQPLREAGEDDGAFTTRLIDYVTEVAAYRQQLGAMQVYAQAMADYQQRQVGYLAAHAQWQTDQAKFEADLAEWNAAEDAERRCFDRIAFTGQVPCNVTGDFAVGDYIVAAANGGGIKAIAVPEAEMTLPLYMKRIGKVWAVTDDGRAWIDVQHG